MEFPIKSRIQSKSKNDIMQYLYKILLRIFSRNDENLPSNQQNQSKMSVTKYKKN